MKFVRKVKASNRAPISPASSMPNPTIKHVLRSVQRRTRYARTVIQPICFIKRGYMQSAAEETAFIRYAPSTPSSVSAALTAR